MLGRKSLGLEGKGVGRLGFCLVAKNDSSLKILEMEVLKPSIHALYLANVWGAAQDTSRSVHTLEGA